MQLRSGSAVEDATNFVSIKFIICLGCCQFASMKVLTDFSSLIKVLLFSNKQVAFPLVKYFLPGVRPTNSNSWKQYI